MNPSRQHTPEPSSRRLVVGFAILLLAAVAWFARDELAAPPGNSADGVVRESGPTPAGGAVPTRDPERTTDERVVAPSSAASPEVVDGLHAPRLRVRLRGLHPDAPWTMPLTCYVRGTDRATGRYVGVQLDAAVAADGTAIFLLPAWAPADLSNGRLAAQDPNYRPLSDTFGPGLDLAQERVVDVQVAARLAGRVVDAAGTAIAAARVTAYTLRDHEPLDGEVAHTNTRADGTWEFQVLTGTPLFVMAVAMNPAAEASRAAERDLEVPDDMTVRSDLLPASTTVVGSVGAPKRVPDLVLSAAAALHGEVRWVDGEPLPGVWVQALPRGGRTLELFHSTFVQRHPDGTLSPSAQAQTDSSGRFVLPASPGAALDVQLVNLGQRPSHHLVQQTVVLPAVQGQPVLFQLPRPVLVRAVAAGVVVPGSLIEADTWRRSFAESDGELSLVPNGQARVRAGHEGRRSAWRALGPDDAGTTVDLELVPVATEVRLEFTGDVRVRNTTLQWRRDDGQAGRERLLRDDRAGPFRLFLEPGRYRLIASALGGEHNGMFLLPCERDVEVGSLPIDLQLPAAFGGTFTVAATDANGGLVGGRCTVRDAAGRDWTGTFASVRAGHLDSGAPGELLHGVANRHERILPPGDYELLLEFEGQAPLHRHVTVRLREVVEVTLRLP
ncbi:MAG: hypothetical protein JNL12_19400 [Planctomycetes bacterium]|nr:hypothetical protein [Planctomycetota bacterium]